MMPRDRDDCDHERVASDDIADGVVGGGRSHVWVHTCLDCGVELRPTMPDEDGVTGWEPVEWADWRGTRVEVV